MGAVEPHCRSTREPRIGPKWVCDQRASMRRLTDCQTATLTGIQMNTWIDSLMDSVDCDRFRRMHRETVEPASAADRPA
jgi:hypothetical protein